MKRILIHHLDCSMWSEPFAAGHVNHSFQPISRGLPRVTSSLYFLIWQGGAVLFSFGRKMVERGVRRLEETEEY